MSSVNRYFIKIEGKHTEDEIGNNEEERLVIFRTVFWADEIYCWGWSKKKRLK